MVTLNEAGVSPLPIKAEQETHEKGEVKPGTHSENVGRRTIRTVLILGCGVLGFLVFSRLIGSVAPQVKVQGPRFLVSRQTNAGNLTWWTCPDVTTTQCAYLTVPRDYSKPQANDTVSIFMRKVPATAASQDRLGSIIINPGGPGGSGSGFVVQFGGALSMLVDGRYDIVGFDPRGVNMTLPPMGCYPTESHGLHYAYQQALLGSPYEARGPTSMPANIRTATERAFFLKLNVSQASLYSACATNGNRAILEAMTTPLIVRDIERMAEALGDDGVNYWGVSYGTVIGSTFAAMKPQLVKRMLLDGVVDSPAYYNSPFDFVHNELADTHKTLTGFLDSCASAGPARCAFAKPNQTSSDLRKRLGELYEHLREYPIPVASSPLGPGVLGAAAARAVMGQALYAPVLWPGVAQGLADAERGDGSILYAATYGMFADMHPQAPDMNVFKKYMEVFPSSTSTAGILCTDSGHVKKSVDEFIQFVHNVSSFSSTGEEFSILPWQCSKWDITPIERYTGPWTVAAGLKRTRFPILYTSLDADPVTPLAAAIKMTKAFGNQSAALLVQHGFGHATIAHPSLCTAKALHDYFVEGKIPAPGTVCQPEPGYLFPEPNNGSVRAESLIVMSEKDRALLDALETLGEGLVSRQRRRPTGAFSLL